MQLSLFEELREQLEAPEIGPVVRLRPYQTEAVRSVFNEWNRYTSTMINLPTGTGKSVCFSAVMDRVIRENPDSRILVLAHREELILQGVKHAQNVGLEVGVEMGGQRAAKEPVIISTVQTQTAWSKCRACFGEGCDRCHGKGKRRRLQRFKPQDFSTLIIDEAHHATADTYRVVMEWYKQNPQLKILMVTATPKRTDNIGLHNVCDSVAYEMDLRSAISQGWLVPIRQQFVTVEGLDLSKVRTRNGDLVDGERERAFLGETSQEEEELLHAIAYPTIKAANGRRALVFAAGQEHAEKLTAAFNAYDGTEAEFVIDKTDRAERRKIVQRFKDGKTQVLVNCMVFTEGFDVPDAAVCANARPTKSTSLYQQMIGRVTRPEAGVVDGLESDEDRREAIANSGKPHCLVLDFTGDSGNHKLVSVGDILAGDDVEPIDLQAALIAAEKAGEPVDIEELIEKAKQAREEAAARKEEARKRRLQTETYAHGGTIHATDVDIFGGRSFDPFADYTPGPTQATQKQVAFLMKLGVQPETATGYSKRQAGAVIDQLTKKTGGDYIVTFGKHAGKSLRSIPRGYLEWAAKNIERPGFAENVKLFLSGKQEEPLPF